MISGGLNGGVHENCLPKPYPIREIVRQIVRNLLIVLLVILAIVLAVYILGAAIPALVKIVLGVIIIGGATATANNGPTIFKDPCFIQWQLDQDWCIANLAGTDRWLCNQRALANYNLCNMKCPPLRRWPL